MIDQVANRTILAKKTNIHLTTVFQLLFKSARSVWRRPAAQIPQVSSGKQWDSSNCKWIISSVCCELPRTLLHAVSMHCPLWLQLDDCAFQLNCDDDRTHVLGLPNVGDGVLSSSTSSGSCSSSVSSSSSSSSSSTSSSSSSLSSAAAVLTSCKKWCVTAL